MIDSKDFARAAHHAGFSIRKDKGKFILSREDAGLPLAQSEDLEELGKVIQRLITTEGRS